MSPWTFRTSIFGSMPAFWQISPAVLDETREKSLDRNPPTQWLLVSCIIFRRTPNSMPYGWGLISRGAAGSSPTMRSKTVFCPSGFV